MRCPAFLAVASLSIAALVPAAGAQTIADIVASSGAFDDNRFDYDTLNAALDAAGLVDALDDPEATLTVFAPNDAAFERLAGDLGFEGGTEEETWLFLVDALSALGGGDPIPVLTDVLLYHVAPGEIDFFDVIIASRFGIPVETLLEGATIQPRFRRLQDNEPDLRDPMLFPPFDVEADNGIVHTIGRVLIPVDLP